MFHAARFWTVVAELREKDEEAHFLINVVPSILEARRVNLFCMGISDTNHNSYNTANLWTPMFEISISPGS
jgi:hypothetical protein